MSQDYQNYVDEEVAVMKVEAAADEEAEREVELHNTQDYC